jgi:hypothetical protein
MNMIEKQAELGKSLYEINSAALNEMAEMSRKTSNCILKITVHSVRNCQKLQKLVLS